MKWTLLLASLILACQHTTAQNWRAMGRGTVGATGVETLYGDAVSDRLLAGGTFLRIMNQEDTVLGVGQAAWNGTRWDSIAHRIEPISGNLSSSQTFWFLRYQGELYACGNYAFQVETDEWNEGLARLNETTQRWEALECVNDQPSGGGTNQLVPKEPGASLYATGWTGDLCGYPQACVYRYDGTAFYEWEPFQQIPPAVNNYVGYVFEFQGMVYMTGSFRNPIGTGLAYFMRHNGTSWEQVPGWGNSPGIKDISIRNDTLYIAGTFRPSTGAPGSRIVYFTGTQWNDMGGGLALAPAPNSASAASMQWFHNNLYVCGQFDHAGGVALGGGIARWNGQQWSALPGAFASLSNPDGAHILDMAVWRDSLYICGTFITIDGEPVRQVAQFIGDDGTNAVQDAPPSATQQLHCWSVDGGANWNVRLPHNGQWNIRVVDPTGRVIREARTTATLYLLDLERHASGMYVVQASNTDGVRLHTKLLKAQPR